MNYQLFLLIKKLLNLTYNTQNKINIIINNKYTQSNTNITIIKLYYKIKTHITKNKKITTKNYKFLIITQQIL